MSNDNDKNYISVGSWMLMMLITAIPIIGQIMVFIWAFVGHNESRKNYYRAMLAWIVVVLAFVVVLAALGNGPALLKQFHSWVHKR